MGLFSKIGGRLRQGNAPLGQDAKAGGESGAVGTGRKSPTRLASLVCFCLVGTGIWASALWLIARVTLRIRRDGGALGKWWLGLSRKRRTPAEKPCRIAESPRVVGP